MLNPRKAIVVTICVLLLIVGKTFGYAVFPSNKKPSSSNPVVLKGAINKVLVDLTITGNNFNCIKLVNCRNITVINCRLLSSKQNGIQIINCKNIQIVNCYFEKTSAGVYALKSEEIKVSHNKFKNMTGPFPKGQMVQFDEVTGKNNKISFNKGLSVIGVGNPEDAINIYKSNGTILSPIIVEHNQIRGGGPSKVGGGIMLGDNGGSYQVARENILVDPGQYGIAIAGGTNNSILNNKIFGRKQSFTNVGIYVWNQHTSTCAVHTVSSNQVKFTNAAGKLNPSWNSGSCGIVKGWFDNDWNAHLSSKILPVNILTQ